MPTKIDIGDGMVCDEVRREDNGKLILIGVYTTSVIVAELPAVLAPWLVVKVRSDSPLDEAMEVKVMLGGKQLRTNKGRVTIKGASPTWIVLPSLLLDKIDQEGRLEFMIRIGSGKWKTVCWLPLTVRKATTGVAIAPQRPS